jgi:carboxypeptidase D
LYAGVVRQERGWTYGLIYGAGHQTPVINPARTFFIRDFFIGNSNVGLVDPDTGVVHAQVQPASATDVPIILPDGVITGQAEVHYKTGLVTWPSATVAAWSSHVSSVLHAATAVPTKSSIRSSTKTKTTTTSTSASSVGTAMA